MAEQIIWTGLRAPSCRRRKCFVGIVERYHEYRSDGRAATGIGDVQNRPDLLVTQTRVFKACGQRRHGCPERFR